MPRHWYDRHAIGSEFCDDERQMHKAIVADRKPYFMRYIYPTLAKEYNKYIKAISRNAVLRFGVTIEDLETKPSIELTDEQLEFLSKCRYYMPVGTGDCTMNRICRRIEREYDGVLSKKKQEDPFDYSVLKGDSDYSAKHMRAIRKLMQEYDKIVQGRVVEASQVRIKKEDRLAQACRLDAYFAEECSKICPNKEELCEILLDLCYSKEKTKQFAWRMCGDDIVNNLLKKNGMIQFPTKDEDGSIVWLSNRYSVASVEADVVE